MVPKKIQYRKQMESMRQLFYYPSRSLHSTHTAFYILPYAQLTNWDDKNSVCFTAYIFNLHSEILQQKSVGSCDKKNKKKIFFFFLFKGCLILQAIFVDWEGSVNLAKM